MTAVWIVSEESSLAAILAHHVAALGETFTGEPERGAFKHAAAPDLLILVGVTETGGRSDVLERLLGFVRDLPARRRAPPPVLFIAADGAPPASRGCSTTARRSRAIPRSTQGSRRAPAAVARRRFARDPARARQLGCAPRSARQYASSSCRLRHAVDPRNAHRRALSASLLAARLLARYVHIFAEPRAFVRISSFDLAPGELGTLLAAPPRVARHRHLAQLDAHRALQDELAHFLGARRRRRRADPLDRVGGRCAAPVPAARAPPGCGRAAALRARPTCPRWWTPRSGRARAWPRGRARPAARESPPRSVAGLARD